MTTTRRTSGDTVSVRERIAAGLPPRRHPTRAEQPITSQRAEPPADNPGEDNLTLLPTLNDEMNRRLDRQWDVVNELDTKAGLLVTLALAAAGLLLSGDHSLLAYAATAGFTIAIALALACLSVRPWQNAPNPDIVLELEKADASQSYARLITAKAAAFRFNQKEL